MKTGFKEKANRDSRSQKFGWACEIERFGAMQWSQPVKELWSTAL